MRVAVFNGPGRPITIESAAEPTPGSGEILVKIGRCGICGSDLSMTEAGPIAYPAGMKLGHEYAGEVVEIGRDVRGVKRGDRVACVPSVGCGACAACRDGRYLMCAQSRPVFGGFGDYVVAPHGNAVVLPHTLSLADGALIEPMACGLHALRMAGMRGGERILVLGAGAMAIAVVYWARKLGAGAIVAASRSAHRADVLCALGADAALALGEDGASAWIEKLGGPPDIVAECVGKPGLVSKAIEAVRPGGTVLSMGMCTHAEPVMPALCAFKEVRLLFPLGYSLSEFAETARAFEADDVRPELMVSDVIALEALPATLESLRAGAKMLKAHVDPTLAHVHD